MVSSRLPGRGRHDNPDRFGCLYSRPPRSRPSSNSWRGSAGSGCCRRCSAAAACRSRWPTWSSTRSAELLDLDDPAVLRRERLRPSQVATRGRPSPRRRPWRCTTATRGGRRAVVVDVRSPVDQRDPVRSRGLTAARPRVRALTLEDPPLWRRRSFSDSGRCPDPCVPWISTARHGSVAPQFVSPFLKRAGFAAAGACRVRPIDQFPDRPRVGVPVD